MALLGAIQMCRTKLSTVETNDIVESLESHTVKLLSLRECQISDDDFYKLARAIGKCRSILQLNLNLGVLSTARRAKHFANFLQENRSLTALFLHGSPIGDEGFAYVGKALKLHPNIVSLDIGDCDLGDDSLDVIAELLPTNGAKSGLQHLTLSANPDISQLAWTKFFMAVSTCRSLKSLNLDYNNVGDKGAACLAVALANCSTMEKLDLEGTDITESGAQVLLHLVQKYPVSLRQLVLTENSIEKDTIRALDGSLEEAGPLTMRFDHGDMSLKTIPIITPEKIQTVDGSSQTEKYKNVDNQGCETVSEDEELRFEKKYPTGPLPVKGKYTNRNEYQERAPTAFISTRSSQDESLHDTFADIPIIPLQSVPIKQIYMSPRPVDQSSLSNFQVHTPKPVYPLTSSHAVPSTVHSTAFARGKRFVPEADIVFSNKPSSPDLTSEDEDSVPEADLVFSNKPRSSNLTSEDEGPHTKEATVSKQTQLEKGIQEFKHSDEPSLEKRNEAFLSNNAGVMPVSKPTSNRDHFTGISSFEKNKPLHAHSSGVVSISHPARNRIPKQLVVSESEDDEGDSDEDDDSEEKDTDDDDDDIVEGDKQSRLSDKILAVVQNKQSDNSYKIDIKPPSLHNSPKRVQSKLDTRASYDSEGNNSELDAAYRRALDSGPL